MVTTVGSLVLLALFFVVGNVKINSAIFAREEALTAARNTRDLLRTTIDSIGDAVISTDAKGRIAFASKAAQALSQVQETEMAGRHFDDIFRIVNEFTHSEIESPVTKMLKDVATVGSTNDTALIAQDGTEIPIAHRGAPIQSEDGQVQGTVLVFRDITSAGTPKGSAACLHPSSNPPMTRSSART